MAYQLIPGLLAYLIAIVLVKALQTTKKLQNINLINKKAVVSSYLYLPDWSTLCWYGLGRKNLKKTTNF